MSRTTIGNAGSVIQTLLRDDVRGPGLKIRSGIKAGKKAAKAPKRS